MLRSVKNLQGFQILASDGAIGSAEEFYFDGISSSTQESGYQDGRC